MLVFKMSEALVYVSSFKKAENNNNNNKTEKLADVQYSSLMLVVFLVTQGVTH